MDISNEQHFWTLMDMLFMDTFVTVQADKFSFGLLMMIDRTYNASKPNALFLGDLPLCKISIAYHFQMPNAVSLLQKPCPPPNFTSAGLISFWWCWDCFWQKVLTWDFGNQPQPQPCPPIHSLEDTILQRNTEDFSSFCIRRKFDMFKHTISYKLGDFRQGHWVCRRSS